MWLQAALGGWHTLALDDTGQVRPQSAADWDALCRSWTSLLFKLLSLRLSRSYMSLLDHRWLQSIGCRSHLSVSHMRRHGPSVAMSISRRQGSPMRRGLAMTSSPRSPAFRASAWRRHSPSSKSCCSTETWELRVLSTERMAVLAAFFLFLFCESQIFKPDAGGRRRHALCGAH